jgi:FkbM family methyltransferase
VRFINDLVTRAARRVGRYGLQTLKPPNRAETLEALVEDMVTIVPVDGARIALYTPFPRLIFRAESLLTKETDTIAWIDGFKPGSVFWDIGANVGVYSLYAAVKQHVVAVAFEPASANFYALTRNIHLNRLDERVNPYCIAFSSTTGLGVLNLESEAMGAASNQFGGAGDVSRYAGSKSTKCMQSTPAYTIDDFIRQFAPPFPNHLKIDVDGLELAILSGARATLLDSRLQSVLVELSLTEEEETRRAVSILGEAGFEFRLRGETQGTGLHKAANHHFQRVRDYVRSESPLSL